MTDLEDVNPHFRDSIVSHSHHCGVCGRWWHDDGDAGCVEVDERRCVVHEGVQIPRQAELFTACERGRQR